MTYSERQSLAQRVTDALNAVSDALDARDLPAARVRNAALGALLPVIDAEWCGSPVERRFAAAVALRHASLVETIGELLQ
jgi:hypothetical protein